MKVVCIPVDDQGQVEPRWGKAPKVAIVQLDDAGHIAQWEEFAVGWDALHDQNGEGQHHARIARFLMDHHVTDVVAEHMGPGMERMIQSMRLGIYLGAHGDARAVVEHLK
jgi:predicted Fe-Mo cluster-binding NifX family protein